MKLKQHLIAMAGATLLATGLAHAAGTAMAPAASTADRPATTANGRVDRDAMNADREALEQKLSAGKNRADYAKILQANGYRIAAINDDKKDYLEYEVVKGQHSYEVQLDFKDGVARATEIDVVTNLWRADATERMMEDANYKHAGPLVADKEARYSDRRNMKAWEDEKGRLEKALQPNLEVSKYRPAIEAMGYQVTAVNDRDKDYVEYEIARGDNSYEVKIDINPQTRIAKEVDVTSNLWEADATDRATDRGNAGTHKN